MIVKILYVIYKIYTCKEVRVKTVFLNKNLIKIIMQQVKNIQMFPYITVNIPWVKGVVDSPKGSLYLLNWRLQSIYKYMLVILWHSNLYYICIRLTIGTCIFVGWKQSCGYQPTNIRFICIHLLWNKTNFEAFNL